MRAPHSASPRPRQSAPVCPACAERERTGAGWIRGLGPDDLFGPAVVIGLRDSLGLCPPHTRALLYLSPSRIGLTQLAEDLLDLALLRRGRGPQVVAACLACRGGGRPRREIRLEMAARPEMLCLADVVDLASGADARLQVKLIEGAISRLGSSTDADAVLSFVAGDDPDAWLRADLRRARDRVHDDGSAGSSSLMSAAERLLADIPRAYCPLCSAGEAGAARYLAWLAHIGEEMLSSEETELCANHAADLAQFDRTRLGAVAHLLRERWMGRLARAYAGVTGSDGLARTRSPLAIEYGSCRACRARDAAERHAENLLAALLDDAAGRAVPLFGFGACHRHVLAWRDRGTARTLRGLHVTRLRIALADIRDEQRRLSWNYRFDSAWSSPPTALTAFALLDGQVFLGDEPTGYGLPSPSR